MDELFLWSVLFVGWRGTCSHLSRSSHIKSFAISSQLSFLVPWNLVELSSLYTSYPYTVFQPLFLGRLHDTGAAICYFISFASWNNFSLTQRTVDWYCKTLEIEVAVLFIQRWSPKVKATGRDKALATPSGAHPSYQGIAKQVYQAASRAILEEPSVSQSSTYGLMKCCGAEGLYRSGSALLAGFFTSKRLYIVVV